MKKEIIELLKSGDFTLAYHDNGCASLYKRKLKYDDLDGIEEVCDFSMYSLDDYAPAEVKALVKALGGKVVSI